MSKPRELPILFSGPMVRAILDGRKTQTRRLVTHRGGPVHADRGDVEWRLLRDEWFAFERGITGEYTEVRGGGVKARCSVGDLLWVRETWAEYGHCKDGPIYVYRADHDRSPPHRWKPSIHMPKRIARIWLRVLDVRVERIQEITEEGAIAEGVASRDEFIVLWESIHGAGSWERNDWVWVYAFVRTERPNGGAR